MWIFKRIKKLEAEVARLRAVVAKLTDNAGLESEDERTF